MNVIDSFKDARVMRTKTPDEIQDEMDNPQSANFSQMDYHFPNGVVCGVGKSRRPSHASLYQLIVTDFNGKSAVKFPETYAGEYTSPSRAEKHLRNYCEEAWKLAEESKTKQVRKTAKAKAEADKFKTEKFDPEHVVSDEEAEAALA